MEPKWSCRKESVRSCRRPRTSESTRRTENSGLFAGPRDVLAEALKEECAKEGIILEVESYDKLANPERDLMAEEPFGEILNKAKNQDYDGAHAGFSMRKLFKGEAECSWQRTRACQIGNRDLRTQHEFQTATTRSWLAVRLAMVVAEVVTGQRRRATSNPLCRNLGEPTKVTN